MIQKCKIMIPLQEGVPGPTMSLSAKNTPETPAASSAGRRAFNFGGDGKKIRVGACTGHGHGSHRGRLDGFQFHVHFLECPLFVHGLGAIDSDGFVANIRDLILGWVALDTKGKTGFCGNGASIDESKVKLAGQDAFEGESHDDDVDDVDGSGK